MPASANRARKRATRVGRATRSASSQRSRSAAVGEAAKSAGLGHVARVSVTCTRTSSCTARPARRASPRTGRYDAEQRRYTLELAQHGVPTPGQPEKLPFVIPVVTGLVAPTAARCRCGSKARARPPAPSACWCSTPSVQLHLRRRRRRAGALAAARLLGAGAARRAPRRRRRCWCCWRTTAIRSTAGKPASGWRCAACWPRSTGGGTVTLDATFVEAMRRRAARSGARPRLQGAGAHAAERELHRRAARARHRPAARARRARVDARAARARAARRLGSGPSRHNQPAGGYRPDAGVSGPARAGQPGAAPCCASTPRPRATRSGRAGLPALQGRRQHDRPLRRAGGAGRRARRAGRSRRWSASTSSSRTRRW